MSKILLTYDHSLYSRLFLRGVHILVEPRKSDLLLHFPKRRSMMYYGLDKICSFKAYKQTLCDQ